MRRRARARSLAGVEVDQRLVDLAGASGVGTVLAEWGSKVSASVALAQRSTFSAPAGAAAPAARTISDGADNRFKPLHYPGLPPVKKPSEVRTEWAGHERYAIVAECRKASNAPGALRRAAGRMALLDEGQADPAVLAALVLDLTDRERADLAGASARACRRTPAGRRPRSRPGGRGRRSGGGRTDMVLTSSGRASSSSASIHMKLIGRSSAIQRATRSAISSLSTERPGGRSRAGSGPRRPDRR